MANDIKTLSKQIIEVSAKIDRNQKSLDQLDSVSKQIIEVSAKIDRNQKSLDQIDGVSKKIDTVVKILNDNEQNLKDLGNLKSRLDLLDKIYVSVDKIAGEVTTYRQQQELNSSKLADHDDRIGKVEKHLHLSITP